MTPERDPAPLSWPELPDESVVELHCLLNDFLMRFESHYFAQIDRYFRERSRESLTEPRFVQPDLFQSVDPNEPPF